jgi:hypothetical protein
MAPVLKKGLNAMPVMVHSLPIGGGNPANWMRAYSHASQVVHLNAAVTCEGNEFSSVEQHKNQPLPREIGQWLVFRCY